MWKGSVSFGLVNIPVKMYTAVQEKRIRFNQLHAVCHTPIKYEKVCPRCKREVDSGEIVRGYEYDRGRYVTITAQEWQQFSEQAKKAIEILRFVKLEEIDPVFFNKTYYLEPGETGAKAYSLLKEALFTSGKIAVAQITIRSKTSLAVIRVYQEILVLETVFYPDEIRDQTRLNIEEGLALEQKELEMARSLITALTEPFRPQDYSDQRRKEILGFIESKIEGQETVAVQPRPEAAASIDLMAALEASLLARQKETNGVPEETRH
ncbi:MAG: Ku protein [Firmicutes bacterium]|nr:Ku protein [Bacillota bacterium]